MRIVRPPRWVKLPNYRLGIPYEQIADVVRGFGGVVFVAVFGSALDTTKKYDRTYNCFLGRWLIPVDTRVWANDVDVLVVTEIGKRHELRRDHTREVCHAYGGCETFRVGVLHFLTISLSDFTDAIIRGEDFSHGVLSRSRFMSGDIDTYQKFFGITKGCR